MTMFDLSYVIISRHDGNLHVTCSLKLYKHKVDDESVLSKATEYEFAYM